MFPGPVESHNRILGQRLSHLRHTLTRHFFDFATHRFHRRVNLRIAFNLQVVPQHRTKRLLRLQALHDHGKRQSGGIQNGSRRGPTRLGSLFSHEALRCLVSACVFGEILLGQVTQTPQNSVKFQKDRQENLSGVPSHLLRGFQRSPFLRTWFLLL